MPAGSGSKYQKSEKLRPRFHSGRIIFAEEIDPKIEAEVEEELDRGEAARFKDILDVLAIGEIGRFAAYCRDGEIVDRTGRFEQKVPDNPQSDWADLAPDLMKRMIDGVPQDKASTEYSEGEPV